MELIGKLGLSTIIVLALALYLMLLGSGTKLPPKKLQGKVSMIVISIFLFLWGGSGAFMAMNRPSIGQVILGEIRSKVRPPVQLDQIARIDDITLEGDSKIVYLMSLNVNSDEAHQMTDVMKGEIKGKACEQEDMGLALNAGVSVEVRFSDRSKTTIEIVTITPADCPIPARKQ